MKKIISLTLILLSSMSYAAPSSHSLTIALDATLSPNHAPLIVAAQQGFFKEQGLDVVFIAPTQTADSTKLLTTHQADIAISNQPQFIKQTQQGLPLTQVGTLIDKPLNCIVALENNGIKSLADLKGKKIGDTSHPIQSLLSNEYVAVSGMSRNQDVPVLESKGHKLVVFFPEEHGVPNYSQSIFIANKVDAKDPRFSRFLAAVKKAVVYLDTHPKETWNNFAKHYPTANTTANKEAWFATMPYFAEDPANLDTDQASQLSAFIRKNKVSPEKALSTII